MKPKIAVIGLGYVGKEIFDCLRPHFHTIGYDVDEYKLFDPDTTNNISNISYCDIFIICVPTPTKNKSKDIDLSYIEDVITNINPLLDNTKHVIIESTISVESIEFIYNKLKTKNLGFSPERFSPGENHIKDHKKVISANNIKTLELMKTIYSKVADPYAIEDFSGINNLNGIKAAILSKIMENTQRMVNIQLMNNFYVNYIDIFKNALDAAKTKHNFNYYNPGLVGGQCIPMDCYFHTAEPIKKFCDKSSDNIIKKIVELASNTHKRRIIILGVGYKANSGDLKYSKNYELACLLKKTSNRVFIFDPVANIIEKDNFNNSDYIIKLVNHDIYKNLDIKIDLDLTCL